MARKIVELPVVTTTDGNDNLLVYDTVTQELSRITPGNLGTLGEQNVQADWNVTDTSSDAFILNKPTIPTGGGTNVQADWTETDTGEDAYIRNKPTLASVATSGSYNDLSETPTIPPSRTDEEIRSILGNTLIAGTDITINIDDASDTITINYVAGGVTPTTADLRHGLSIESDPALIAFADLTDVTDPTDPQTVSTGVTQAGQYFHIFSPNTHDIQTITDTVLSQVVYQDGLTSGNIFTKTSDAITESSIVYDAYSVGPFNAGVDEEYIVRFT